VEKPEITIQLSEDDYVEASLIAAQWTKKRWLVIGTMGAVYLGLGLFMVSYAPHAFFVLGWALIGAVIGVALNALISRYFFLPRRLKSRFVEHKTLQRSSTVSWSEDGLIIERENSHALIPWGDFFKFRESEEFVLLYTSRVLFLLLPKRFFNEPGQLNDFMVLVRSQIGIRRDGRTESASFDKGGVA
jgi:hypothetical protein